MMGVLLIGLDVLPHPEGMGIHPPNRGSNCAVNKVSHPTDGLTTSPTMDNALPTAPKGTFLEAIQRS